MRRANSSKSTHGASPRVAAPPAPEDKADASVVAALPRKIWGCSNQQGMWICGTPNIATSKWSNILTITHNIGHTNYAISALAKGVNVVLAYGEKYANSCTITVNHPSNIFPYIDFELTY